jgi:dTDP-4-amino-4,6-dideoxygalactose transaminase
MSEPIPFNRPSLVGSELEYVREAVTNGHISGNGPFARRCARWLEEQSGVRRALMTHSATGALELAAILASLEPGDEVIMPSFTFVSTANAVALRGAVPVFVEVREDTLNLDETLVEEAITPRTRAIMPVHYAGIACEMDTLVEIALRHELLVIEDAAQALFSTYKGRPLGGIGDVAALSFHETKNVTCGEGGALLVRDEHLVERAEIVHEKGTDRSRFFRGQVDKYSWVDLGSSFLLSDLNAAFLWGQLEDGEAITESRLRIWDRYHASFADLEDAGAVRRPIVPSECRHNAHLYYLLLPSLQERAAFIQRLAESGVNAVFHYVALHESAAGMRYGRPHGDLTHTTTLSERLVRLPLWTAMTDGEIERVISAVRAAVEAAASPGIIG